MAQFEEKLKSFVQTELHNQHEMTEASTKHLYEAGTMALLNQMRQVNDIPVYCNPRRRVTQPSVYKVLKSVLGCKASGGFTCPEQADLVSSVGSPFHVFGVLPTGAGKSLAFFGAPYLLPDNLFIVINPLIALTADLEHRLRDTGISGGV